MRSANASLRSMAEMTLEQWAELPEDVDGELVDGRLVERSAQSRARNGRVLARIERFEKGAN